MGGRKVYIMEFACPVFDVPRSLGVPYHWRETFSSVFWVYHVGTSRHPQQGHDSRWRASQSICEFMMC